MNIKQFVLSVLTLVFTQLLTAQIWFDPSNPDKSEKTINKLVSAKINDLKKNNVKKIIIFNCVGEYVLSRTTSPGAWEAKDMPYYDRYKVEEKIKTTESPVLNQEYCVYLTSQFLDSVVAMFKVAGIEVVPAETWQKHEAYQEMKKLMLEYDKDEGTKYNYLTDNVTTRKLTVPAYDYRVFPENIFKAIKYTKLENYEKGKMLEAYGAEAFCNIIIKIDGTDSKPSIRAIDMFFQTGAKKIRTGTKDKEGNEIFTISMTSFPAIVITDMIQYNNSTLNSKNFVDVNNYNKAITEMYSYILSLYADKIKAVMSGSK
jgi:hypothetical protein